MKRQLEDKLTYNAPLFNPEQALSIFQVREVELQLLDELRKLSRSKSQETKQKEDGYQDKLFKNLMKKYNLKSKILEKDKSSQNLKSSKNQQTFINFLIKSEEKISSNRYGKSLRMEPNHRKLFLRNKVLGPMQLNKIFEILVSKEKFARNLDTEHA